MVLPWTTLVAVVYSVLSFTVEPTLDLAAKEEQHLFYWVVALYAVSAAVSIIAGLELSVSDDGGGLPNDCEARGHGFRNMRADAERRGGRLKVESKGKGGGTIVACVVPRRNLRGGE